MSSTAATSWAMAYRPLRLGSLLAQGAVLVGAETLLLASYRGHEASFHWATHFLIGLSVAALTNLAWLVLKGAPARWQLLSILAWHLVAMFPDLLFAVGIAHDGWMDVFVGHISSHYVPGGVYTWLFTALTLLGLYCVVLSGWLSARHAEADAGLAPAIGVGGGSLVRPQGDPSVQILAHARWRTDHPPEVVLLHGLGASRAVWTLVGETLEQRGVPVLAPDLLGFGESRTLGTRFHLDDHVEAVRQLLNRCSDASPLTVVGHSFGCAVAVALANREPHRVRALVLVSPPVFRDGAQARARLGARGWLARRVLSGSPVASFACGAMCLLRRPAAGALARLARGLPERVARDGVQHSWPAYRDALADLLDANPLPRAVAEPPAPTTLVIGDADPETPAEDVLEWPHDRVVVVVVAGGDHLLPLRQPATVAEAVARSALR